MTYMPYRDEQKAALADERRAMKARDKALEEALKAEMAANQLDFRLPTSTAIFGSLGKAFREYERLGYHPLALDANGKRDDCNGDQMVIRANGLCTVNCSGSIPLDCTSPEWFRAPLFCNSDGSRSTFIFTGCGEIDDSDVLGFSVRSWQSFTLGWEHLFEKFLVAPPQGGLTWIKPPTRPKAQLPVLPAALRFELARRQTATA